MSRAEKTQQIEAAKKNFDRAISVALVNFQGLTVETVTDLRREFRKAKVEYKVLKNTVIRHALKESPYTQLVGDLRREANKPKAHAAVRGMTGVAWSYEDPAAPVKVIEAFKKAKAAKAEKLTVKTGMVSGSLIAGEALGKMPGLKETQAMILTQVVTPAAAIYSALATPGAMIIAILQEHVKKLEAGGQQA